MDEQRRARIIFSVLGFVTGLLFVWLIRGWIVLFPPLLFAWKGYRYARRLEAEAERKEVSNGLLEPGLAGARGDMQNAGFFERAQGAG
jgi:hypothetical protein